MSANTDVTADPQWMVGHNERQTKAKLRGDAIRKVMEETGCTRRQASVAVGFITMMANHARGASRYCDQPGVHHLTWRELRMPGYAIMDKIMPHGEVAVAGSAHEAVQQLILGPSEYALMHDNPTGEARDCTVTVLVHAVTV